MRRQPVAVTTQFITDDGTDSGKLTDVKQFYTRNGKTIEHPMYTVNGNQHNTISDDSVLIGLLRPRMAPIFLTREA